MCIKPSIGRVIFLRKFVYNRLKNYSSIINISLERKATDFYATEYEKAQLSMKVYGINFDSFAVWFLVGSETLTSMKVERECYHQETGMRVTAQREYTECSWKLKGKRWEVTSKEDSRDGTESPGRWRVSSQLGSFKEAGSAFLPQDCCTLWNITMGLKECLRYMPGRNCYCHLPCKQLRVMSACAWLSFYALAVDRNHT